MKTLLFSLFALIVAAPTAMADVASTTYVEQAVESKVDVDKNSNQNLQGQYTVSGSLYVPTPQGPWDTL